MHINFAAQCLARYNFLWKTSLYIFFSERE